jgi:hypothetical protein
LLYRAVRDLLPARTAAHSRGERYLWRIDRVFNPGRPLPIGEYDRSIGHWNSTQQTEAFHVEQGCVVMLVLPRNAGSSLRVIECETDSIVSVPPGSWDLTYACDGPATVTDVYTDGPRAVDAAEENEADAKYSRGRPVRAGLRASSSGPAFFGNWSMVSRALHQHAPARRCLDGLRSFTDLFAQQVPDTHFAFLAELGRP